MERDQAGVLGRRVLRVEDERLLTVGGTYVDDVRVPELTRAARVTFVRSPCARSSPASTPPPHSPSPAWSPC